MLKAAQLAAFFVSLSIDSPSIHNLMSSIDWKNG